MNKIGFLFIAALYITISIFSFAKTISIEVQLAVCSILIAFIGIPHGAIDHILFIKTTKVKPMAFYASYVALMLSYLVLWFLLPMFSFAVFLILSAYHFGESQFAEIKIKHKAIKSILFMTWGLNILSALILYNQVEFQSVFSANSDLAQLLPIASTSILQTILVITSTILLTMGAAYLFGKNRKFELLFREIYTLFLIHITFYLIPLLPAFTLYFVILHSAKVLVDEYTFLHQLVKGYSIYDFIKALTPFTVLSLIGAATIGLLIHYGLFDFSYILIAIVLISILTLPHSIVMNRFYNISD
ncbi:MAG: Brp/Blh family beta-carotene 15,15'-dioxygenase [Saprospiraceae bacterium]|nr:Brp/Blh family beta-carotene 15,15'-dioxygenase [Saprospiraceae bacterium]